MSTHSFEIKIQNDSDAMVDQDVAAEAEEAARAAAEATLPEGFTLVPKA